MRASAVAGLVFANINDTLLKRLTSNRAMASVPFGGRYRLIDFTLSNLVNAGVFNVGIITKENYRSLMDHIGSGIYWDLDRKNGGVHLISPYLARNTKRYVGTVDALYGAMDFIEKCNADYIVLCNGDTISNVDVGEAVKRHIKNGADVTLVYHNGIAPKNNDVLMFPTVDEKGRVTKIDFNVESDETVDFYAGIAIISRELLIKLATNAYFEGKASITKDVLPNLLEDYKIYGYKHNDFVAVLDSTAAYYNANMQLLNEDARKQLFHTGRPVFTKTRDDMPTRYGTKASVQNSMIADGCVINGTVKNSILFRGVTVEKDAVVENCILMQETSVGSAALIENVIADKNAVIGESMTLKGTPEKRVFLKKNQTL